VHTETPVIYATGSGGTTIDQDAYGGNPFATALIELSRQTTGGLTTFARRLRALTRERSGNHQTPTWIDLPAGSKWSMAMPAGQGAERRVALVLIVSEYRALNPPRLVGAANDERRIAAMLAQNGFSVQQGVPGDKTSLGRALRDFSIRAQSHDSAVIYSTGHGVELNGNVYLLPGDYPLPKGDDEAALKKYALPVTRIAQSCRAAKFNLAFFAGCRTLANRKPT
jgi:hypothetical protein